MITQDQLDILKDIFANSDEGHLMTHLTLKITGHRAMSIELDKCNSQDFAELESLGLGKALGKTE